MGWIAMVLGLLGCNSVDRRGGGIEHFRLARGGGALIVACHELNRAIITETVHVARQCEVKASDATGEFTLTPLSGQRGTYPVTALMISQPGFALHEDSYRPDQRPLPPDGRSREIVLVPASGYAKEAAAVRRFEIAVRGFDLTPEQRRMVDEHLAARQIHLRKTYPNEIAAAQQRLSQRRFQSRPGLGRRVLAVAVLPDGGLAVLTPHNDGRALVIVDSAQTVVAETALAGPATAAGLVRDGDALVVVDGTTLRRFDFTGAARARIPLTPAPAATDVVTSLAVSSENIALGLANPSRLRLYTSAGKLITERDLPAVVELTRVFLAPSGAILVQGKLAGNFEYDLLVAGMRKVDGMPRGLVRLTDMSAAPEVVLKGIDSTVATATGLLAYAADLYRAEDAELVASGVAGVRHQLLLSLSWDGKIETTRDVSDAAVGLLELGQGLGDRRVFFSGDQLYELDADPGSSAPKP